MLSGLPYDILELIVDMLSLKAYGALTLTNKKFNKLSKVVDDNVCISGKKSGWWYEKTTQYGSISFRYHLGVKCEKVETYKNYLFICEIVNNKKHGLKETYIGGELYSYSYYNY